MADGKGKTVPGDRANVTKGSLELLASARNSESSSICSTLSLKEGRSGSGVIEKSTVGV